MQSASDGRSYLISFFDYLRPFRYRRWIKEGCWMVKKNLMKTLFSLIFFSSKNLRTVLSLSPDRRLISSFVHAKEDRSPSKPHTLKNTFGLSFLLVSHDEKLSSVGAQNCGLFIVVAQNR